MMKLNVLHVSHHCCVRVVKEALGIYGVDPEVRVQYMASSFSNLTFSKTAPPTTFYSGPQEFALRLRELKTRYFDFDLIHVHNEPDWMVQVSKQVLPDIPVILDAHDLFSARLGVKVEEEEGAFTYANGFIFPSEEYRDHAMRWHESKGVRERPSRIIYSMCIEPMAMIPKMGNLPHLGGIVYEGGLRVSDPSNPHDYLFYRDYRELFTKIIHKGVPVFLFGTSPDYVYNYEGTGAVCFPPQPYGNLMRRLPQFDWGFCGAPVPCNQWDWAMPNKLFEYISAGLPVLVYQSESCAKFVEEHKVGMVIDDLDDLPKILGYQERTKKRVLKVRDEFLMEKQIPSLLSLYEEVLNGCSTTSLMGTGVGETPGVLSRTTSTPVGKEEKLSPVEGRFVTER